MYNVKDINEKNVFVIKRDNAVKYVSRSRNTGDSNYLPAGTIIHMTYLNDNAITDDMLKSAKTKGARMRFSGRFFINNDFDVVSVMPCQLRRATKEEVAQCIKYVEDFNNALKEKFRKNVEKYEKENAERIAKEEREARELDKFKRSLKGKWTKFIANVMRKCAVRLLFLAGACNKKQIANNKRLGNFNSNYYLTDDIFEQMHGMTMQEFIKRRNEFIDSGHDAWEWDEKYLNGNDKCCWFGIDLLYNALGIRE